MKQLWRTAALLAAFAAGALPSAAAEPVFPPEADDYISLTADLQDGDAIFLSEPAPCAGGVLTVRVTVPRGAYLSYETDLGDLSLSGRAVRMDGEDYWGGRYDYFLLDIAADGDTAGVGQDFRIRLGIPGLSVMLGGRTAPERRKPLLAGMEYDTGLDGTVYELRGVIEDEPALARYPKGLSVAFLGDYGEDTVYLDASVRTGAEGRTTVWDFRDRPSFLDEVTVSIEAPEGATVYEVAGGKRRALETRYRDGALTFRTQGLTEFELAEGPPASG